VSVPTLRAWERRFGFPSPLRLPGGHRRYSPHDTERIRRVVDARASGTTLEVAISTVTESDDTPSLFASMRRAEEALPVHVLSRRTMLAISHAIEDEVRARAERAVLVVAFQRAETYRAAQSRWDDLARTAEAAVVFADFPTSRRNRGGAHEVALPSSSPLRREWAVVCAGPTFSACLAGWERTHTSTGAPSAPFEASWTAEPDVARRAAVVGLDLARRLSPDLIDVLPTLVPGPVPVPEAARAATSLTNRIVAALDS
jgi:DICT domain-containing protein